MSSAQPFAAKKFLEIKGRRMAYIDEGEGASIVFAHGNPTSSYLWRNVMPACRGLGRLIACDMIGMGDRAGRGFLMRLTIKPTKCRGGRNHGPEEIPSDGCHRRQWRPHGRTTAGARQLENCLR